MKIQIILPESSIDYPGRYGPVFFTNSCNFRCRFCHNPSKPEIAEKKLENSLKDIGAKIRNGWYNGLTISGGEPTLQNDLIEFIERLRKFKVPIKLDTNGSRPEVLEKLLDKIDYVALDVKSPLSLYEVITGVDVCDKVRKSIGIVTRFRDYEFRTTFAPLMIPEGFRFYSADEALAITKEIIEITGSSEHKYFLQRFIPIKGSLLDNRFENFPETPEKYLIEIREEIVKFLSKTKIR